RREHKTRFAGRYAPGTHCPSVSLRVAFCSMLETSLFRCATTDGCATWRRNSKRKTGTRLSLTPLECLRRLVRQRSCPTSSGSPFRDGAESSSRVLALQVVFKPPRSFSWAPDRWWDVKTFSANCC